MSEGKLTRNIKEYLKERGAYAENIWGGGFQASGIPDILACYNGRFLGLEVKLDYNSPSPIQKAKLAMINKAGGVGQVVRSVDEVKVILDKLDEGLQNE